MDERTKELIAIGASVAGHCQPCLTFHVDQAKQLGIGDDDIKEAVAVGKMVEKGAMVAMNKFAQSLLDSPGDSLADSPQEEENRSKTLKVYDPAMCCSTGVCGPNVDSALVEFSGALKRITEHGITVERWNLAQQPQAFAQNPRVKKHLTELGNKELPFIYIDDELKLSGRYPTARELFALLGMDEKELSGTSLRTRDASQSLVVLGRAADRENTGGCCPDGGCCS